MNILKIEKPLIEWEKELDVWLVDFDLKDHLVPYNKMDAFSKIYVSNVKRGWTSKHYDLYYSILLNKSLDTLVLDEFKTCFSTDICDMYEERPLIEWEKDYNVWLSVLPEKEHFKSYYRYQADAKLKKFLNIFIWNKEAQDVYDSFKGIKHTKESDSKKQDNIIVNDKKKKTDVSKSTTINAKKEVHKIYKPIFVKKSKNKKRLRNSVFKKAIAFALVITTSISAFAFSKFGSKKKDDFVNNNVFACDVLTGCESFKIDNLLFESESLGGSKNNSSETINKKDSKVVIKDNIQSDDVLNNELDYVKDTKVDVITDDVQVEALKSIDTNNNNNKNNNNFVVGDVVSISKNSDIYGSCYDAMNGFNGLDPYYSSDLDRVITGICLEYNNNVIYSVDNNEINDYLKRGASVVSYSTMVDNINEGFYNVSDVKVLKKQI